MTEEELDLLASAYLDGEATSEEVALVERDPDLVARVEAMRSISAQVSQPVTPPSTALKEQHLAAAMALFESGVASGSEFEAASQGGSDQAAEPGGGQVIDLTKRAARSARRAARPAPARTMPRWLPAAAAVVIFGAGGLFVVQNLSGEDGADTAALDASTSDDDATDTAGSDGGAEAEASSVIAADESSEDFADDDAMSDDADADDSAGDALMNSGDDAADGSADDAESAPAEPEPTTTQAGGSNRAVVGSFAVVPAQDELLDIVPEILEDPDGAVCGGQFEAPAGFTVMGFFAVEIDGTINEVFVIEDGSGDRSALVLDTDCGPLEP